MGNSSFLIADAWNAIHPKNWPYKTRKHMRPSEIGMPFIDRWANMNALEITNPFPERVLRIFDAGNVIEYIVLRAMALSGILHSSQDWLSLPETEEHLGMKGRLDAVIGGIVDWKEAEQRVRKNIAAYATGLEDDIIAVKTMQIIDDLKRRYPKGWKEQIIVEVKSINSMSFHKAKRMRDADGNFIGYHHNKMQLYSYLQMSGLRAGLLLYVSKDDMTLAEVPVRIDDTEIRDAFFEDITSFTKVFRSGEMPPKEKEVVYNEQAGKFEINWNVSRSLYLKLLYGYQDPNDLEARYHQRLLDINRALRHLRADKVKPEDVPVIEEYKLEEYKFALTDIEDVEALEDYELD